MEYSVSIKDQVSPSGGVKYLNFFSGLENYAGILLYFSGLHTLKMVSPS